MRVIDLRGCVPENVKLKIIRCPVGTFRRGHSRGNDAPGVGQSDAGVERIAARPQIPSIPISGGDLFVANENSGTAGEYTTSGTTVNASLISGLQTPLASPSVRRRNHRAVRWWAWARQLSGCGAAVSSSELHWRELGENLQRNLQRFLQYPERFAHEALGLNSKAVHRAYAKRALMKIPSLEDYEQRAA